ncbi:MAG: vanadium-dependent haloperoxidase, partial [Acidobacteria bacterium]|nr:vanadium-dependent haloperoxidase [Acidobacteriota bacterium]
EYVKDYREVMEVGDSASVMRPADRADGARFYAAVLAVATWNPAVRQVAAAEGTSLSENARAFALLNVAISDALVSVMETKYHYTFWRPETAIPGFVPLIATPCFPGYPSAHASASYAAEEIARRIFGAGGHSIVLTSPPAVGVTLTYNSFKEIARDIDDARVYGGIHFRFDQEAGAVQGRDIGKYVYKNMLRPVQP